MTDGVLSDVREQDKRSKFEKNNFNIASTNKTQ